MTSLSERFGTNKEKEKEGIWFTVHVDEDAGLETQFKITRQGVSNPKFLKVTEKLTRPYRAMGDNIPILLALELQKKAYMQVCILDWKNVNLGNGQLPFTIDNLKLVCDALPDVLNLLMTVSNDASNFQDSTETDVKN